MAKYTCSPWGYLIGALDDAVGSVWKGIRYCRVRISPTQRGTLEKYWAYKDGLLPAGAFSFPQFNIRRLVFSVLGYIARLNLSTLMYPVWQRLVNARGLALTHTNLFISESVSKVWDTMPDKGAEFSPTNKPDFNQMLIADGDLERATSIISCIYDPTMGTLTINWDPTHYQNGADDDEAFIVSYVEPIIDAGFNPNGWLYGTALTSLATRVDGTAVLSGMPTGLTPADIHGYVFFKDALGVIGFSPSKSSTAS